MNLGEKIWQRVSELRVHRDVQERLTKEAEESRRKQYLIEYGRLRSLLIAAGVASMQIWPFDHNEGGPLTSNPIKITFSLQSVNLCLFRYQHKVELRYDGKPRGPQSRWFATDATVEAILPSLTVDNLQKVIVDMVAEALVDRLAKGVVLPVAAPAAFMNRYLSSVSDLGKGDIHPSV